MLLCHDLSHDMCFPSRGCKDFANKITRVRLKTEWITSGLRGVHLLIFIWVLKKTKYSSVLQCPFCSLHHFPPLFRFFLSLFLTPPSSSFFPPPADFFSLSLSLLTSLVLSLFCFPLSNVFFSSRIFHFLACCGTDRKERCV